MNTNNLNNGYLLRVHFFDGTIREFGPYPTTSRCVTAFRALVIGVKLHMTERELTRPCIDRRYRVEFSKKGISSISVTTLENDPHLTTLANPKG